MNIALFFLQKSIVLYNLAVRFHGIFSCSFAISIQKVYVIQSEFLRVTCSPLKVVQQRPGKVPPDVTSIHTYC